MVRLRQLMNRLQEAGLTINLAKFTFGRFSVVYLGHVVGGQRGGHAGLPFPYHQEGNPLGWPVSADASVGTFPP